MRKAAFIAFSGLFALFSLVFPLHSSAAPIPYPDGGSIAAWGAGTNNTGVYPHYGQSIEPDPNEGFVVISSQLYHNLAVSTDGSVVAWGAGTTNTGDPHYGQSIVPEPNVNFMDVSAGWYHSLGLKTDGSITAWGAGTTNTGVNPHYG